MDDKQRDAYHRYAQRTTKLKGGFGYWSAWALVAASVQITGRMNAAQRRRAFEELGYPKKQARGAAA